MSADKLVFDLSQEVEGSPQIFLRKDWLNILDNMNTNYNSNQTIIDTSALSNSNKYMAYREAYLSVPINLCLTTNALFTVPTTAGGGVATRNGFNAISETALTTLTAGGTVNVGTGCDYVLGMKNWFGSLFHSLTLDMNGTTIIQQTALINMVNMFRLQTTLSWGDVQTQGKTIGFYPDTAESFRVTSVAGATTSTGGSGVCYNTLFPCMDLFGATEGAVYIPAVVGPPVTVTGTLTATNLSSGATAFSNFQSGKGNKGLLKRIQGFALDPDGIIGSSGVGSSTTGQSATTPVLISSLLAGNGVNALNTLYKGYIFNKGGVGNANGGIIQTCTVATVYLKHLHSFFAMCPLLKGTFFKLTCFLNNSTTNFTIAGKGVSIADPLTNFANPSGSMQLTSVSVPVGGVNPLMITDTSDLYGGSSGLGNGSYVASCSVGPRVLASTHVVPAGSTAVSESPLSRSIYLYVPSYSFSPIFEQAYLSSPVKTIKYSDYYQYQIVNVASGGTVNSLLTNGIANAKSVLILGMYSSSSAQGAEATGLPAGLPVYQSPFDIAGCGGTSPMIQFTNFNIVVSGQNAIYNTESYSFQQFNNQFKGINAVNGDMTDGLTSGLIDEQAWFLNHSYWYVNISRMHPVEQLVPKSIQVLGTNQSSRSIDLICFIEYEVTVNVDVLTGARVG